uniref:uncharacterized protein isoform X2 n=1 Tax=Myxine glutinosa TaxID=7769 RepID=UPI00358EF6E7
MLFLAESVAHGARWSCTDGENSLSIGPTVAEKILFILYRQKDSNAIPSPHARVQGPNAEEMAPPEGTHCDFVGWLSEQDVDAETASMVINQLGINSSEILLSSTETPQLRAEFFALIKGQLPFARYAMLRRVVELHGVSLDEPVLLPRVEEGTDDQSRQEALNIIVPEILINYLERASEEMHNFSKLLKEYHGLVDQASAPSMPEEMQNGD